MGQCETRDKSRATEWGSEPLLNTDLHEVHPGVQRQAHIGEHGISVDVDDEVSARRQGL